jgi:ATP-dependent DNA helicase DinG
VANENIFAAIQASQGQAFVLFTSYTMLEQSYTALKERLESSGYPILKQGDAQRNQLLHQFIQTKRSVLFGTSSFWEGIDVAGDALRCVIMVKLPFKVPNEPIVAARTEFILQEGGNPFIEYSVPNAIVKFKQGFGRLIRNRWDRGCIVCLDTRLINKSYGQLFLNSLPPCGKFFGKSVDAKERMVQFYKETYYLVNKSPFSN